MTTAADPSQPELQSAPVPNVTFSLAQQQLLAGHGLLLPLLKAQIISQAISGVTLSDEERGRSHQQWAQHQGLKSDQDFQAHCRTQLLTPQAALAQAELPARVDRHVLEHFVHRAEKRFLERKAELDRVVYSLIRVQDKGLAQELYLRIAEGEGTFADLAASYSQGDEKSRNGIVGPAPLNQSHPQITERLRSAQPKQLFAPFFISPWWIVLRLEDLKAASFDDEMKLMMGRDLFQEWVNEQLQSQMLELQRLLELRPSPSLHVSAPERPAPTP
ncbi:MAG: peptidylprolyl isomerase [Cyanobium sp.]